MKKLALFAFAAGAAVTMSSMASAQYYEAPRHHYQERQHYRPTCEHGYKYEHGRCVQIYVRPHCQDGYAYRDGYCQPVYRKRYNSY